MFYQQQKRISSFSYYLADTIKLQVPRTEEKHIGECYSSSLTNKQDEFS